MTKRNRNILLKKCQQHLTYNQLLLGGHKDVKAKHSVNVWKNMWSGATLHSMEIEGIWVGPPKVMHTERHYNNLLEYFFWGGGTTLCTPSCTRSLKPEKKTVYGGAVAGDI